MFPKIQDWAQLVGPKVLVELGAFGSRALQHSELEGHLATDDPLRTSVNVLREAEVRRFVLFGQLFNAFYVVLGRGKELTTEPKLCNSFFQLTRWAVVPGKLTGIFFGPLPASTLGSKKLSK